MISTGQQSPISLEIRYGRSSLFFSVHPVGPLLAACNGWPVGIPFYSLKLGSSLWWNGIDATQARVEAVKALAWLRRS